MPSDPCCMCDEEGTIYDEVEDEWYCLDHASEAGLDPNDINEELDEEED